MLHHAVSLLAVILFDTMRKDLCGVHHHERFERFFRRWQEPCCWDVFTDFSSIVISSLLATGFGVIYSSAIWWRISNEIVWESLNKKKKNPKRGEKNRRGVKVVWEASVAAPRDRRWRGYIEVWHLAQQRKRMARQVGYFKKVACGFYINSRSHSSDMSWHLRQKCMCMDPPRACTHTHSLQQKDGKKTSTHKRL